MADSADASDSPLEREDQEIAAEVADDAESLLDALPHLYRGEISQANSAQDRIDRTTNWAITFLAAVLSIVFSSAEMPAYLVLVAVFALCAFLSYEVRRYRFYDLYRARVRLLQENLYANALHPVGASHDHWREELGEDLRDPTFKVSVREALARRLHRIYGLLFAVAGVAWLAKVTLFTPETQWAEAAALPGVPGAVVAIGLGAFYLAVLIVAEWRQPREAKGEIHGTEAGDWKRE